MPELSREELAEKLRKGIYDFWQQVGAKTFGQASSQALLRTYILETLNKQAASGEALRWIPVEEKMPENDMSVLFFQEGALEPKLGYINYGKWFYDGAGQEVSDYCKVTHWQPLPAAPDSRPSTEEKSTDSEKGGAN